jgi:molybdopterin-binding protein
MKISAQPAPWDGGEDHPWRATANVTVEVAGMTMVAAITVDAVKDLGLAQGSEVTVIVKASDVMLATRS